MKPRQTSRDAPASDDQHLHGAAVRDCNAPGVRPRPGDSVQLRSSGEVVRRRQHRMLRSSREIPNNESSIGERSTQVRAVGRPRQAVNASLLQRQLRQDRWRLSSASSAQVQHKCRLCVTRRNCQQPRAVTGRPRRVAQRRRGAAGDARRAKHAKRGRSLGRSCVVQQSITIYASCQQRGRVTPCHAVHRWPGARVRWPTAQRAARLCGEQVAKQRCTSEAHHGARNARAFYAAPQCPRASQILRLRPRPPGLRWATTQAPRTAPTTLQAPAGARCGR